MQRIFLLVLLVVLFGCQHVDLCLDRSTKDYVASRVRRLDGIYCVASSLEQATEERWRSISKGMVLCARDHRDESKKAYVYVASNCQLFFLSARMSRQKVAWLFSLAEIRLAENDIGTTLALVNSLYFNGEAVMVVDKKHLKELVDDDSFAAISERIDVNSISMKVREREENKIIDFFSVRNNGHFYEVRVTADKEGIVRGVAAQEIL